MAGIITDSPLAGAVWGALGTTVGLRVTDPAALHTATQLLVGGWPEEDRS